ncbi:glycosyltransferase [Thiotrichales bacterium 19S11-10]|nr:glycosyltransferase [Thiotrichales bacterium 19S11-10]
MSIDLGKVSVIIPSYQHASYIAEAITSVIEQSYQNIELIIVDNYSKDETKEIVDAYLSDARVKFVQFDNQGVIAASRNYGASLSSGQYLAFLDSDDIWHKDKLLIQLESFTDDIAAISTQFEAIGDVKSHYNHLNALLKNNKFVDFSYQEILASNPVITSSLLMRKEDFQQAGGFDESKHFICIEDWELWLRVCKKTGLKIRVLNQPLVKYLVFISPSRKHTQIEVNTLEIFKKHFLLEYLTQAEFKHCLSLQYYRIGVSGLKNNDYVGMKYFLKACRSTKSIKICSKAILGIFGFLIHFSIRKLLIRAIRAVR